jgi:catecholate siderophore receptor
MNEMSVPRSLRAAIGARLIGDIWDGNSSTRKATAGCLLAVASMTAADAQEQTLPPVTVEAPAKRPAASKPTPEQLRVRAALRRAARVKREAEAKAKAVPTNTAAEPLARDPYADPAAPRPSSASRLPTRRRASPSSRGKSSTTRTPPA